MATYSIKLRHCRIVNKSRIQPLFEHYYDASDDQFVRFIAEILDENDF